MSASRSASINFAAAHDRRDKPLPDPPPGWKWGHRIGGWGPYELVRDESYVGEPAPEPARLWHR